MTEAEWRNSTDPVPMLEFLLARACKRKLRLMGVACCRRVGPLMPHDYKTLTFAEDFADGLFTNSEDSDYAWWDACAAGHDEVARLREMEGSLLRAAFAIIWTDNSLDDVVEEVRNMCSVAMSAHERSVLVEIIHELFGPLPFRPDSIESYWLTWNDGIVRSLAEAIYAEHAFDQLPILGDALEEAGCTSTDILSHCRQPGEHVRGCWVVDLVLGKEKDQDESGEEPD